VLCSHFLSSSASPVPSPPPKTNGNDASDGTRLRRRSPSPFRPRLFVDSGGIVAGRLLQQQLCEHTNTTAWEQSVCPGRLCRTLRDATSVSQQYGLHKALVEPPARMTRGWFPTACIAYELVVAVLNNILLPLLLCLTSYVVLKPQPKPKMHEV
jgi:hypothetical protein